MPRLAGVTATVAPDATPFTHRGAAFNFDVMYIGDDPAENEVKIAAVREYYKEMEPHMAGYYNNLNEESEQKTWGNYGSNYPRLVELKNQYDPGNLFRLNANIKPSLLPISISACPSSNKWNRSDFCLSTCS